MTRHRSLLNSSTPYAGAFIVLVLAAVWACCSAPAIEDRPAQQPLASWISSAAHPLATVSPDAELEDLAPLRAIVGDARVVLIGESRHDASEHFLLKHRVIRFLVEEMGFDAVAFEESFPTAAAVDAWLQTGEGDPEQALAALGGWYLFDTEEMLGLVHRLRRINTGGPRSVRFFGVDISDAGSKGLESVLGYLGRVDPEVALELEAVRDRARFSADFWPAGVALYQQLEPDDVSALRSELVQLGDHMRKGAQRYGERSSDQEYRWHLREADLIVAAHDMFAAMAAGGSFVEAGLVREAAMADNVQWLLDYLGPESRIVVCAHNVHVAKGSLDLRIPQRPPTDDVTMLGGLLAQRLGDQMISIGMAFSRGSGYQPELAVAEPHTVDGVLARAGAEHLLLDLAAAPKQGPVHRWLTTQQWMRAEGGTARLAPAAAFDALIFTTTVSPTRRSKRCLERLRELAATGKS